MRVSEFVRLATPGTQFKVFDATYAVYSLYADKDKVEEKFGDMELIGFEAIGENKVVLYVK